MYYPTVYGLPIVKNKSICLLTLHEEIPIHFSIYKKLFTNEISYCFNTVEELQLFQEVYGFQPNHYSIVGMNINIPTISEKNSRLEHQFVPKDYVVYVGRLDRGKKVYELIEYFLNWKSQTFYNVQLVILGEIPKKSKFSKDIIFTGYVSDESKYLYIRHSLFVINPSPLESFSIVTMEAWSLEKAVLVNGHSIVLKRHCERSHGGLYYTCKQSFFATMDFLLSNPNERSIMGENGRRYVELNYREEVIEEKLNNLVQKLLKQ